MPEYLLSVHATPAEEADQAEMEAESMARLFAQVDAFNSEVQAAGAWVYANGLQPPASAQVVDAEAGTVTPGLRGESTHRLGGFWVIKAPDLAAALDWARNASAACESPVEVRPFQEEPTQ